MANLILIDNILPVLDKGCWHGNDPYRFNICEDCAADIRAYILRHQYGIYTPTTLEDEAKRRNG